MKDKKAYAGIVVTGAVIGLIAVVLVMLGNPKNMGFCIACFLRDIAGATKLHSAPVVQYFRPEIVGLIGGALIMAMVSKEFSPKGGSAPVTRFFLGAFVMIGALVFLGCPLRMVLRIGRRRPERNRWSCRFCRWYLGRYLLPQQRFLPQAYL